VYYIFHGEDEFGRAEELARLRGEMAGGDRAMAELNTTYLDGRNLTLGELRHNCDTIPFMADRRVVIVDGLLGRLAPGRKRKGGESSEGDEPAWKRAFLEELAAYLPVLPPTTRLFFVESKKLPASHPILKLAGTEAKEERGYVKLFMPPKDWELPAWIHDRARGKGGSFDNKAATRLAQLVGPTLRLLDLEIDKLLLYADGRSVSTDDVQILVSRARETNIFDLVDAVGRRQTGSALRLLHGLLEDGEPPLKLFGMLARQVRILIQVSELRDQGLNHQEITTRLKLHPFVVEKGLAQARSFEIAQLETAHRHLVETDWSIKTGKTEPVLALDMLIVDLASS
jgi:DNA polymerase-3 subunit delta